MLAAARIDDRTEPHESSQRRCRPGGRALEGQQPPAKARGTGGDEDYLVASPLSRRDLADQAGDDVESESVAAGNGARAELYYLSGHG